MASAAPTYLKEAYYEPIQPNKLFRVEFDMQSVETSGAVVDLTRSPQARLKPVPLSSVRLQDEFWQPRRDLNRTRTLKSQFEHIESTGRLANFRRAAGRETGEFEGIYFNDSDVYKWLEAAASTLAQDDDAQIRSMIEQAATDIAAAQQEDGFLHTYFTLHPEKERWENLRDMHQLYCMGHFIQAAVAHFRSTGDEILLNVARRLVDCIEREFGWGKREQTDGHEEIELALIELYRATQEPRYLNLAQFFLDVRGKGSIGGSNYYQDHVPLRELDRMTGHAVRALYYAAGATDLFLETGEDAVWQALEAQWKNFTQRQMYISGGAGSRWEGEAFGFDWELPNQRAYTETCAAIAAVMWSWRMGQRAGEARFFDVLERSLYNGVLCGLSLSGDQYFYQNPLANDGSHRRQHWFGCACCPPNVARLLAQLPGYFYSVSDEGVWLHLFANGEANLTLQNGERVRLKQQTRYPWDGEVLLTVEEAPTSEFSLFLRIPQWAKGATVRIGDETHQAPPSKYFEVRRVWQSGDSIVLQLPMEARLTVAHPYAMENAGRVAVERGPLLYCVEGADCPDVDLRDVALTSTDLTPRFRADLLGGVTILEGEALVTSTASAWDNLLYADVNETPKAETQPLELRLIPYHVWANREAGPLQVWLKHQS
jgi:DUF1680 family protein